MLRLEDARNVAEVVLALVAVGAIMPRVWVWLRNRLKTANESSPAIINPYAFPGLRRARQENLVRVAEHAARLAYAVSGIAIVAFAWTTTITIQLYQTGWTSPWGESSFYAAIFLPVLLFPFFFVRTSVREIDWTPSAYQAYIQVFVDVLARVWPVAIAAGSFGVVGAIVDAGGGLGPRSDTNVWAVGLVSCVYSVLGFLLFRNVRVHWMILRSSAPLAAKAEYVVDPMILEELVYARDEHLRSKLAPLIRDRLSRRPSGESDTFDNLFLASDHETR